MCASQNVCPYFLSRESQSTATLLFVPYNYLIDSRIRETIGTENLENAVVIFDEVSVKTIHIDDYVYICVFDFPSYIYHVLRPDS